MLNLIGFLLCGYGFYLLISGISELSRPARPDARYSGPAGRVNFAMPPRVRRPPSPALTEPQDGKPGNFARLRPGVAINYRHPTHGNLKSRVAGTIKYIELWQRRKSPSEPWVPTGNLFTAHLLENNTLVYEWKGGLMLLDEWEGITDAQIKQQFATPARRFGESDETARVNFAYPPGSWLITDIGKFEVRATWGQGLRLAPNATGRFIHAAGGTGLEGRSLVVEDYLEGHGGQDTVWLGWQIVWEDILNIET